MAVRVSDIELKRRFMLNDSIVIIFIGIIDVCLDCNTLMVWVISCKPTFSWNWITWPVL